MFAGCAALAAIVTYFLKEDTFVIKGNEPQDRQSEISA